MFRSTYLSFVTYLCIDKKWRKSTLTFFCLERNDLILLLENLPVSLGYSVGKISICSQVFNSTEVN